MYVSFTHFFSKKPDIDFESSFLARVNRLNVKYIYITIVLLYDI